FIVSGLVDDFDGFIARLIVKPENVTTARPQGTVIVFAVGVGLRCVIFAIPQTTHHIRMIHLAMLERDKNFIINLGQKVCAAVFSPAMGAATRAQWLSTSLLSHGKRTFTRCKSSGSLLLVTIPTTTP